MYRKSTTSALAIRPAALTLAIALGLVVAPVAVNGHFGLEGAAALAKSDKGKAKGKKKDKASGRSNGSNQSASAGGSPGNSGNPGNPGGSGGGSGSLTFGSDGTQVSSAGGGRAGGKPRRSDWSKDGALEYKAALDDWKSSRGKPQAKASLALAEEDGEEEIDGLVGVPSAPVRAYTKLYGLNQGYVASLLKSWNGMNGLKGNLEGKLERMEDNPNALYSEQLAYFRDSATAGAALGIFTGLGGDPDNPPSEDDVALAEAALDQAAIEAAQAYLDAQTVLADTEGLYNEDQISAATEVVNSYEGPDPIALLELAETGDPQNVIEQYEAWADYGDAAGAADSSFLTASRSYSEETDAETIAKMRELVDAIGAYSGISGAVAEY